MGNTYTHRNYTPNSIPGGYSKDVRELVSGAVEVGWKLMVNRNGSLSISAPPPHQKVYHFTNSRTKSGPLQGIQKSVIKFADQSLLDKIELAKNEKAARLKEEADEALEIAAANHAGRLIGLKPVANPFVPTEKEIVVENEWLAPVDRPVAPQKKTITRQHPLLARRGSGKKVASKSTVERVWNDGTVDYACLFCDFHSDKKLALSGHASKHVYEDKPKRDYASLPPVKEVREELFGHRCENCGVSDEACWKRVQGGKKACCGECANTDTHGHSKANLPQPVVDLPEVPSDSSDAAKIQFIREILGADDKWELETLKTKLADTAERLIAAEAKIAKQVENMKALKDLLEGDL